MYCLPSIKVVVSNVLPDHQHSMDDVFMSGKRVPTHPVLVEMLFGGYDNWDAEYFIHIAEHGYMYERTMAFFPLLPTMMRFTSSTLLFPLSLVMPFRSMLLISGVMINSCLFCVAAILLYLLTMEVSRDRGLALTSSALFCFNPASVFMCAVYSESLFACLSFAGMLLVAKHKPALAALVCGLAVAARSNGTVLAGYVIYFHSLSVVRMFANGRWSILSVTKNALSMVAEIGMVLLPLVIFQWYGHKLYCSTVLMDRPPWCDWTIPLPYSYIQSHYWDVGFLRYYQLKQLPNFLLAMPAVLLALACVVKYCTSIPGEKASRLLSGDHHQSTSL